jgi:hypothetical protein
MRYAESFTSTSPYVFMLLRHMGDSGLKLIGEFHIDYLRGPFEKFVDWQQCHHCYAEGGGDCYSKL